MEMPIDKLINKTKSLYKLVVMTARRAIEIGDGAAKLTDMPKETKPANAALREILEDRVTYKEQEEKK